MWEMGWVWGNWVVVYRVRAKGRKYECCEKLGASARGSLGAARMDGRTWMFNLDGHTMPIAGRGW